MKLGVDLVVSFPIVAVHGHGRSTQIDGAVERICGWRGRRGRASAAPYFQTTNQGYVVGLEPYLNVSIADRLSERPQPPPTTSQTTVIGANHAAFDRDCGGKGVAVFEGP